MSYNMDLRVFFHSDHIKCNMNRIKSCFCFGELSYTAHCKLATLQSAARQSNIMARFTQTLSCVRASGGLKIQSMLMTIHDRI
jgi:hypothetical protein